MTEIPRCPCGWSHESLLRDIAKEELALRECGTSRQISTSTRERIETLKAHLAGSGCTKSKQPGIQRARRWRIENS